MAILDIILISNYCLLLVYFLLFKNKLLIYFFPFDLFLFLYLPYVYRVYAFGQLLYIPSLLLTIWFYTIYIYKLHIHVSWQFYLLSPTFKDWIVFLITYIVIAGLTDIWSLGNLVFSFLIDLLDMNSFFYFFTSCGYITNQKRFNVYSHLQHHSSSFNNNIPEECLGYFETTLLKLSRL